MKKPPEQPAASDAELFQSALEGVIPIAPSNRMQHPPAPKHFHPSRITAPVTAAPLSDHLVDNTAQTTFLRNGLNTMTLRKLRRGTWPVEDAIDLHGSTSDEAGKLLMSFIQHAKQHNMRCVSVIHGKGWRSEGGEGILKIRVRHWLTQIPEVIAFCEPPPNAGGGGAVWILLRSQNEILKNKHLNTRRAHIL
jgi:DNA-nicking Smr family endonuclease